MRLFLRRWQRVAFLAASAVTLAGCASMEVSSYTERGVDFSRYLTYEWGAIDAHTTGDPRLDNNPFFHERVRAAVDHQLARRGYVKGTGGQGDVTVHYHASVHQEIDVNGADEQAGLCPRGDCEPFVYQAGTLLVDLVDAKTSNVIWRGWATGSVDGVVENQEWMERRIDEIVGKILERLPPRV
jgi:hypothetical protein